MGTLNISVTVSGQGGSIARSTPRTADGGSSSDIPVPASKAGTLTTRTDNETGTLTLDSGHGIVTGQIIDLYWSTGARFGITVGTVSGTSVPIGADDSGTGDVLPTAATAIVAAPRVAFNCAIDGDSLAALAMQMLFTGISITSQSHVTFEDSANDEIAQFTLEANVPRVFDVEGGDSNPFTGDPITHAYASNGSATAAATLKILWVQDTTP